MKKILNTLILICLFISSNIYADIPLLYLDENGVEKSGTISEQEFEKMTLMKATKSFEIAESFLSHNSGQLSSLTLKGVLVGLEVFSSVGVGAFNLGAGINQQFYFELKK